MSETIRWAVQFQVSGGGSITKSNTLVVDAYDKITATIPADGNPHPVNIQPDTVAGHVQLIVINADPCGTWLSYTIDTGTTPVKLDAPQAFIGVGAVGLMQTTPPETLTFTIDPTALSQDPSNSTATASIVQILVGRNAS